MSIVVVALREQHTRQPSAPRRAPANGSRPLRPRFSNRVRIRESNRLSFSLEKKPAACDAGLGERRQRSLDSTPLARHRRPTRRWSGCAIAISQRLKGRSALPSNRRAQDRVAPMVFAGHASSGGCHWSASRIISPRCAQMPVHLVRRSVPECCRHAPRASERASKSSSSPAAIRNDRPLVETDTLLLLIRRYVRDCHSDVANPARELQRSPSKVISLPAMVPPR